MTSALKRVAELTGEALSLSPSIYDDVIEKSEHDIRQAVNALQFLCTHTRRDGDGEGAERPLKRQRTSKKDSEWKGRKRGSSLKEERDREMERVKELKSSSEGNREGTRGRRGDFAYEDCDFECGVRGRDSKMGLFSAIGKVLYNKRDDDVARMEEDVVILDPDAETITTYSSSKSNNTRGRLSFRPEELIERGQVCIWKGNVYRPL